MGQGGHISITNNTSYDWKKTYEHSYQMSSWKFPNVIKKGENCKIYVEWDESWFRHWQDDAGEAVYTFDDGSQNKILVKAKYREVSVDSSEVKRKTEANRFNNYSLGWKHNGIMNYIVTGDIAGGYIVSGDDFSNWMTDMKSFIGEKKIKKISMPGSHDSGMSICQRGTAFANEKNTVTQTHDIGKQLEFGTRYFDIRPTISGGQFYTGHYSSVAGLNIGANGQKLSDIVDQINKFTETHNELIILNISHSLNTDLGQGKYRKFDNAEWQRCLKELSRLNFRYQVDEKGDLSEKTLNSFLDNKYRVLIIIEELDQIPDAYKGKGFFPYSQFNVYNKYSNTDNVDNMMKDQLNKMKQHNNSIFLLSWTMTQSDAAAATSIGASILDLAESANQKLDSTVYPVLTATEYPCIVYTDKIDSSQSAAFCCAVNWKNR